jgi:AcrR family transcriptional regulator
MRSSVDATGLSASHWSCSLKIAKARKRSAQTPAKSPDSGRLDATAWVDAALLELNANGIDRVRVEVLAKQLGVTKGSFYWHFKDRDALLAAMLEQWRRRATLLLIERLDRQGAPPDRRLRELLRLPLQKERSAQAAEIELAIRLWGRTDARARAALEEVDELRLRYIGQLLVQSGTPPDLARARAILAYSYLRVASTLIPAEASALMEQCEDLLVTSPS